MPSAKIHEAIAKEINKDKNMDEFLLRIGTVSPDAWRNTPSDSKYHNKFLAHFNNPELGRKVCYDYDKFYNKYKEYLDNPFYYGYLIHLIVDYYWKTNIDPLFEMEKDGIKGYKLKDGNFHDNSNYFEYYDGLKLQKHLSKIFELGKLPIELPGFKCEIEEMDLSGLVGDSGTLSYINSSTIYNGDLEETDIYDIDMILRYINDTLEFTKKELNRLEQIKKM